MSRLRHAGIILSLSPALMICALAHAQPAAEEPKADSFEAYFDFRGKALPKELHVLTRKLEHYVHSEPEGLRVTLPKDRDDLDQVVIATRFGLAGDFEITATLEILNAEPPPTGYGAGATMYLIKKDKPGAGATLGRLLRPGGKDILLWNLVYGKGQPPHEAATRASADKRLQMRFKRTGAQLSYQVSPGLQENKFEEVAVLNFGTDDVRQFILIVTTGNQPAGVDVRWLDLSIRSAGVPGPGEPALPAKPSRAWLVVTLGVVLVFALLLVAGVVWRRRQRRQADGVTTGSSQEE